MGDVGIHNFLDTHGLLPKLDRNLDVFLTVMKAEDAGEIARIAAQLRESGLNVAQSIDVIGLGKQMTLADKLGAKVVLIQGEEERAKGVVALKVLKTGVQIEADESELVSRVRAVL
jgi:histidyl-tRNA synthetase